jgi:hypothetical protein
MNDNTTTRIKIGEVRLSYCHLFQPEAVADGGEKKYSVSLLIPKSNAKLVTDVKAAIKAAFQDGISSRFGGKQPAPGTWKNPLRDGDAERPDDETYAGCYFINATSKTKPGIVKIVKMNGEKKLVEVTDENEVYSGCYGVVSVNFFAFNNAGNKGVAAGLNNVLKTKDGEFLGGRASAQSEFGDDLDQYGNEEEDDVY